MFQTSLQNKSIAMCSINMTCINLLSSYLSVKCEFLYLMYLVDYFAAPFFVFPLLADPGLALQDVVWICHNYSVPSC